MSHLVTRRWEPDPSLPAATGAEMPFQYEAYVPDEIAGIDPSLTARTARLLSEADAAVRELNEDLPGIAGLEAMSRQLLRQESVASSRIEGLEMSQRRLARAAVVDDDQHRDTSAEAILANIAAMEHAINVTSAQPRLEVEALIDIHRVLMEKTRDAHIAGVVRASQNWIGGNGYNPRGAAFIPPPEREVGRLLPDLAAFMNRQDLPITLQAAVAHAQFETIHPFADGNGRTGRCLIHVVYKRSRAADRFVPPVSLVLATEGDAYVRGLTSYREDRLQDWCADFALTVIRACRAARLLAQQLAALQATWLDRLGSARQDSSSRRLIGVLAGQPILRVQHVVELLAVGTSAAHNALNDLEAASVLKQVTVGKRNRAWEAVGLLALIDAFERTLATPEGAVKAVRRAPRP
jgi:Fic family protein